MYIVNLLLHHHVSLGPLLCLSSVCLFVCLFFNCLFLVIYFSVRSVNRQCVRCDEYRLEKKDFRSIGYLKPLRSEEVY